MTGINIHYQLHLLALLALLALQGPVVAIEAETDTTALTASLQEQLATGGSLQIKPTPDWWQLRQIYRNYNNRLLWHEASGRTSEAGSALKRYILDTSELGLDPAFYHAKNLTARHLDKTQQITLNDLLLTDGFLRLSRHLAQGQLDPGTVDPLWKIPVEQIDAIRLLDQALISLDPVSVLDSLNPQSRSYRQLLQALADYRQIENRGGWPALPEAPLIRPGEKHDLIPLLRQRLTTSNTPGTSEYSIDPNTYDPQLQQRIEGFQQSHGLKQDGIIGPLTRAALNVPIEQRIAQIKSNLERWRWLPRQLGERYILVNIGGYLVQLVEHDQVQLENRTIIGRPMRNTPSFTTRVTHLVLNPTWTVPRRIAVEDLLPEQRRDSEYLLRKNIQIQQREGDQWVDQDPAMIDWGQYNRYNFPFRLRQSPGDGNSLGRIKFHMPNPYTIFLHDTPAQGLFAQPVRDFSSGCVRVEGIRDFVHQLLARDERNSIASFTERLASRESSYFKLSEPIDVFLVYFTTWVDLAGEIQFRPDIYNLDRSLILSLQQLYPSQDKKFVHREAEKNALPN